MANKMRAKIIPPVKNLLINESSNLRCINQPTTITNFPTAKIINNGFSKDSNCIFCIIQYTSTAVNTPKTKQSGHIGQALGVVYDQQSLY